MKSVSYSFKFKRKEKIACEVKEDKASGEKD
jgi:hypothetical protein